MARPAPHWVHRGLSLAELALLALIAFVCVKIVISLIWPQTFWKPVPEPAAMTARSMAQAAPAVSPGFDPFYRNTPSAPAAIEAGQDAPETSLDLKLFGLRADDGESRNTGSAILETPDRVQKTYRIGDEIISGVVLRAVTKGYIVLESGGHLERLTFIKAASGLSKSMPAPAKIEAFASEKVAAGRLKVYTPAQIMAAIRLTPEAGPSGMTGFRVTPRGSSALLQEAGLQSGDIITAINGQSLGGPAALTAMASQMSRAKSATLSVSRNNVPKTVRIGR